MMSHADGWMGGWSGVGVWPGVVIALLLVALVGVLINRFARR